MVVKEHTTVKQIYSPTRGVAVQKNEYAKQAKMVYLVNFAVSRNAA